MIEFVCINYVIDYGNNDLIIEFKFLHLQGAPFTNLD